MALTVRTKKDVVTEFRSTEILKAARTVFASKGYQAATVDEIADFAGIAKGTVYCYFPSKAALFIGTLRGGMQELYDLTYENMKAGKTAHAKIRAFIRTRLEYCDRNREFFNIYFTEFSRVALQPSPVRVELQDVYHRQAHVLESVIAEGVRGGELRPVPARRTAYLIYEATRSAIAHRIQGWDTAPIEESEEFLLDLIWNGVQCK